MGFLSALAASALLAQDHPPPPPEGARFERDIGYAAAGSRELTLDLYLPAQPGHALSVRVHRGAWRAGNKYPCTAHVALRAGFADACVSYRLRQLAKFPAQIHGVKASIRWLRAPAFGYDASRIGVWESPASGHLVARLGTSSGSGELEIRKGEGHGLESPEPNRMAMEFFQQVLNAN